MVRVWPLPNTTNNRIKCYKTTANRSGLKCSVHESAQTTVCNVFNIMEICVHIECRALWLWMAVFIQAEPSTHARKNSDEGESALSCVCVCVLGRTHVGALEMYRHDKIDGDGFVLMSSVQLAERWPLSVIHAESETEPFFYRSIRLVPRIHAIQHLPRGSMRICQQALPLDNATRPPLQRILWLVYYFPIQPNGVRMVPRPHGSGKERCVWRTFKCWPSQCTATVQQAVHTAALDFSECSQTGFIALFRFRHTYTHFGSVYATHTPLRQRQIVFPGIKTFRRGVYLRQPDNTDTFSWRVAYDVTVNVISIKWIF